MPTPFNPNDHIYAEATQAAEAVRFWRGKAQLPTSDNVYGFTRRQCLLRARSAEGRIVNLAIGAEKLAEREAAP